MSQVMVDIESLGTTPGSLILSIGAVQFGKSGITGEFYRNIEPLSSLLLGLTVDPRTVQFWNRQPRETKAILFNSPVSVQDALYDFANFFSLDDTVWAKGPDFDLELLKVVCSRIEMPEPWRFRNTRDVRTILDVGIRAGVHMPELFPKPELKHSALEDARYQANQVIKVYDHLSLWE